MILRSVLLLSVTSILLAGCAGNKIDGRKRERVAAYAALSPAQQRLVDDGRIDVGMPADVVYIAWGKPAMMVPTAPGNVTWIYRCKDTKARPAADARNMPPSSYDGRYYNRPRGMQYMHIDYECAEVNFENNVVKSWRELPKPGI